MSKIVKTYRYIPFGTKVHIVTTNDINEALDKFIPEQPHEEDGSAACFHEGEGNECYLIFKSDFNISDIIHEVTHMVEFVLDYHGVKEDSEEYSETMAYGISFWSEVVLSTFVKNMPLSTKWVKEYVGNMDSYLHEF